MIFEPFDNEIPFDCAERGTVGILIAPPGEGSKVNNRLVMVTSGEDGWNVVCLADGELYQIDEESYRLRCPAPGSKLTVTVNSHMGK